MKTPLDIAVINPIKTATFKTLRVCTARNTGENSVEQVTEPYEDDRHAATFIALYGVKEDGTLEHIADRKNQPQMAFLLSHLYGAELVEV